MDTPSVLLVDDEERFREILGKRLSRLGFSVRQAESGEQGLERMAEEASGVVVLDVKMPGMDGIETLERLRRDFPGTETILLTGHASTDDGIAGIKAGAFDYLTKPVELDHLAEKIRQAQDKIRRRQEQQAEREFRARVERRMAAAERLASLGTLVSGIAHEVNNPLAVINDAAGWLQDLMRTAPKDMPMQRELRLGLEKITTNVDRARRITHQLLRHARHSEPEITDVDVASLCAEARDLVAKLALSASVCLEISAPEEPVIIRSDRNQLRQVLINLLNNAIHASPACCTVTLDIEPGENTVRLTVSDCGPGIPEDLRERIFEPFFSTKPEGVGTGLGLFVTNDLVQRLGGAIRTENRAEGGASFTVTLPCRSAMTIVPLEEQP